jgi:hypothetical protein
MMPAAALTSPRDITAVPHRLRACRTKGFDLHAASRALNGLDLRRADRSTLYGNPFPAFVYGAAEAVDLYRRWIDGQISPGELGRLTRYDRWYSGFPLMTLRERVLEKLRDLAGTNIWCWCELCALHVGGKPCRTTCAHCAPCHVDVILDLANPRAPAA